MRSDALIGDRGAAGYKESTQGVGMSVPPPCVAEFVIRRGETAGSQAALARSSWTIPTNVLIEFCSKSSRLIP